MPFNNMNIQFMDARKQQRKAQRKQERNILRRQPVDTVHQGVLEALVELLQVTRDAIGRELFNEPVSTQCLVTRQLEKQVEVDAAWSQRAAELRRR
jgi:hypothetical protein